MAVLRSLSDLRTGVAYAADVTIGATGGRQSVASVNTLINGAVTRWYRMVAECGEDAYSGRIAISTDPVGNPRIITLGTPVLFVRGVELLLNDRPISLHPAEFAERNDIDYLDVKNGDLIGFPLYYKFGTQSVDGNAVLRIFPAADAVYTGIATVIPPAPVLALDADTIEVFAGGDEWIINDAACSLLRGDGLADTPAYQEMMRLNEKYEKDLRFMLGCRNPIRKIDFRGEARRNRIRSRIIIR